MLQKNKTMKNVFYFILTMLFISCAGTSKFVEMEDYSELNGEYYAYSVEENNLKGTKFLISLMEERINQQLSLCRQPLTAFIFLTIITRKEKPLKKHFPFRESEKTLYQR